MHIYLPLYSDRSMSVSKKSGLNAWNGPSKTTKSQKNRPIDEVYIPIPIWIHQMFPHFFGFNALDKEERKASNNKFNLLYPSGSWKAIITQDSGKALETDPQNNLGYWILRDILKLPYDTLLTLDLLIEKEIDSIKITQSDKGFYIEIAEPNGFEQWKLQHKLEIQKCVDVKRKPTFRGHISK